ncbi:MAG: hypothetical protein SOU51_06140 [Collinsella sp.]|nr:hypothetical protein [Collinsella sp.]
MERRSWEGDIYDARRDTTIGNTQLIAKRKGLFEGLSLAQVAASSAAAATSMLLASRIGIAGSVIGAAVSSVVTLVATQLYRRMLTEGARKLQEAKETVHRPRASAYTGSDPAEGWSTHPGDPARGARIAPTKIRARAAAQRARMQRKIALVSIALSFLTLALVCGAILLGTAGEGLGTRPDPIFSHMSQPEEDVEAPAEPLGDANANTPTKPADGAGSPQEEAGQDPAGPSQKPEEGPMGSEGSDGQTDQGPGTGTGESGNTGDGSSTGSAGSGDTTEGTGTKPAP